MLAGVADDSIGKKARQIGRRAVNQEQLGVRGVVADADAGRGQRLRWLSGKRRVGLECLGRAGDGANLLQGDRAGAVDDHGALRGVEHGGFDAVVRRACVEDGVDAAVKIVEHVCGGGGAGVAEAVGAGRGDGHAALQE